MLINRIPLTDVLSFGSSAQELKLEPLNVLIGPNGSGKSNFIATIGLLKAAPRDLHAPIRDGRRRARLDLAGRCDGRCRASRSCPLVRRNASTSLHIDILVKGPTVSSELGGVEARTSRLDYVGRTLQHRRRDGTCGFRGIGIGERRDKNVGNPQTSNFPTLLGQAFSSLNLSTLHGATSGGNPMQRIERAMYELACGINQLRNKQGTGHGHPWLPSITRAEARTVTECMGIVAEYLLSRHSMGVRK